MKPKIYGQLAVLAALVFVAFAIKLPKDAKKAEDDTHGPAMAAGTEIVGAKARDFENILAIGKLKTSGERRLALGPALKGYGDVDFAGALAAIMEAYGKDRRLFNEVFDFWCKYSPEGAARWAAATFPEGKEGRLLREKAGLMWAAMDFDVAFAWMLTLPDKDQRWSLASAALAKLAELDPVRALNYLSSVNSPQLERYGRLRIFEQWAGRDPAAAFEQMAPFLEKEPEFIREIQAWGRKDTKAALDWVIAYGKKTEKIVPDLLSEAAKENRKAAVDTLYASEEYLKADVSTLAGFNSIMLNWARTAPAEVSAWLDSVQNPLEREKLAQSLLKLQMFEGYDNKPTVAWKVPFAMALTDAGARQAALTDIASEWAYNDPDAALRWAATLTDPAITDAAFTGAVGNLAQSDPTRALQMVANIDSAGLRQDALKELIFGWSQVAPAEATQWAWSATGVSRPNDATVNYSLQAWVTKDANAAIQWINANQPSASLLEGAFASVIQKYTGVEAARILSEISDRTTQQAALVENAKRWLKSDPEGAAKWIAQSTLTSAQKETLLRK